MAQKILFSGYVNDKHFDNVADYNAEITRLIGLGKDFSANSSTESTDEPEHDLPGIKSEQDLLSGEYIDRAVKDFDVIGFDEWADKAIENAANIARNHKEDEIKFILKRIKSDLAKNNKSLVEIDAKLDELEAKHDYLLDAQAALEKLVEVYTAIERNTEPVTVPADYMCKCKCKKPETEVSKEVLENLQKLVAEIFGC